MTEPGLRPPVVRVLVVDDQPLIRHSLRTILEAAPDIEVVGEAATGSDAVASATRQRPDVVLMDIRMPHGDGLDATRAITADPTLTGTRVLVLSMFELDEYVNSALRNGASGFLLKDTEPDLLVDAVRRTHRGESLFAPAILTRLVEHYLTKPAGGSVHPGGLTDREIEVLTLVGRGLSNQDIGAALVISMGTTVKTHIGSLLAKLAARDRAQLVIAAYDHGLVSPRSQT